MVDKFANRMGIDTAGQCAAACMDWDELASLAADPLVTIGAHTLSHPRIGKLALADARREMEASAARIETMIGIRPRHFAYPFGDVVAAGPREFAWRPNRIQNCGDDAARCLSASDRERLTALPRISLNGNYQRLRHLRALELGAATAAGHSLRLLKAASAG